MHAQACVEHPLQMQQQGILQLCMYCWHSTPRVQATLHYNKRKKTSRAHRPSAEQRRIFS
jgi:hypothetical protein